MGNIPTNYPQSFESFIHWIRQELENNVYGHFIDKKYLLDALSELDNYHVNQ